MICEYGCGQETKHQFKNGKWCCSNNVASCKGTQKKLSRSKPKSESIKIINNNNLYCDFGCNNLAKYKFKNGKYCCSSHYSKCPQYKVNKSKNFKDHPMYKFKIDGHNPFYKRKHSIESKLKLSKSRLGISSPRKYNLERWKANYPFFFKIENIKEDKLGNFYGQCKNHNCPNSKEQGGWFKLNRVQFWERINALERGNGGAYLYCSDKCKNECPLFGLNPTFVINQNNLPDEIYYTSEEYQIWRNEVLKRQFNELGFNECEICGNRNISELAIHHEKLQKTHPELSLDPDNGIILCGSNSLNKCHYKYGHKDHCSTGKVANIICERIIKKEIK